MPRNWSNVDHSVVDRGETGIDCITGSRLSDKHGLSMKILLTTSFHEHLRALLGFHLNWRCAFSDRMFTIAHLSAATRHYMLAECAAAGAFPSANGLVVNPVSIPTRYGCSLSMMIHNSRIAQRIGLESSHICLASPYLYALQYRLDEELEGSDCSLPEHIYPLNPTWYWHDVAAADKRLLDLAKHLGVKLKIGRADGVVIESYLYNEMLSVVSKFISCEEIATLDPIYPMEELIFPTVLPALLGHTGRIAKTRAKIWEPGDEPTLSKLNEVVASGLYASAKRIPQDPSDPLRQATLANLPGLPELTNYMNAEYF